MQRIKGILRVVWPLLLLFASLSNSAARAYVMEQVESRPIDGHRFVEGNQFRFVCRAVGSSDLAVRMICPLTRFAPNSIVADACFENCGRPLCNQPGLHDCSTSMRELSQARCVRTVSQLMDGSQEIVIQYTFPETSARMSGTYACQYKNMRSSVVLTVDATTTTSSTSTTTATTSTATTSKSTTSPTTRASSTVTPRQTTATTNQPTSAVSTRPTVVRRWLQTTQTAPLGNDRPSSSGSNRNHGRTDDSSVQQPKQPPTDPESELKTGSWFYSSLVGKLVGIDIILIVLFIVLAIVLLTGFLFIRCQVVARHSSTRETDPEKPPLHTCCARLLCINVDSDVRGGGTTKTNQQYGQKRSQFNSNQKQNPHQRLLKAPPTIHPFSNGSDTASGQVYSEANLDSSYYSQGEGSDVRDAAAEYRLQTHFDASDARAYPIVSGSQRGPPRGVAGGFFNRDAPDRHSFHNVRQSRQRPAIPVDLLMRPGGGGGHELSREEIRDQVEKQRREIDNLRQLLRDSQQQLSRLASSQQELHRSVSVTRMPTGAVSASTPEEQSATSPMADPGDYELLASTSAPANQVVPQTGIETRRSSADLLDQPIQEEELEEVAANQESQESLQYPTVRSANQRRSSIGEAYAAGRLCPA